jgi:hypothetical protein
MKFKTLKGSEVRLEVLPSRYPLRSRSQAASRGQYNLGRQLKAVYGSGCTILEEFPIPDERLFIDFYMPHHSLAFEYQGEQHDKFNKFFHGDKAGFRRSQERDARKRLWCEVNDINLVEVREVAISREKLIALIQEARDE